MTERNTRFDNMLDDLYPQVEICGVSFSPSQILFDCDPVAYSCACSDAGFDEEDEDEQEA